MGSVFHVTPTELFESIRRAGVIKPSGGAEVVPSFDYPASFGRRQGHVCLFDLRVISEAQLNHVLDSLYFLDPWGSSQRDPSFLMLDPKAHDRLIPWTTAQREAPDSMFIWYGEAWFPGELSLELIDHVFVIEVQRPPLSPFEEAHRRLRAKGPAV